MNNRGKRGRVNGVIGEPGCGSCGESATFDRTKGYGSGSPPFAPFLAVLFFGSLWGFAEATVGALLHLSGFVYKGALMANVGFFVMAAAASSVALQARRPWLLAAVGLVAALFKVMDAFILSVPVWERMIANPAVAILLESLAFASILSLAARSSRHRASAPVPFARLHVIVISGVAAMFASTAAVACVFRFALGRGPAGVGNTDDLLRYIAVQGGLASLLAAGSAAAGALAGNAVRRAVGGTRPEPFGAGNPGRAVLGFAAAGFIAAFWAVAALIRVSAAGG